MPSPGTATARAGWGALTHLVLLPQAAHALLLPQHGRLHPDKDMGGLSTSVRNTGLGPAPAAQPSAPDKAGLQVPSHTGSN